MMAARLVDPGIDWSRTAALIAATALFVIALGVLAVVVVAPRVRRWWRPAAPRIPDRTAAPTAPDGGETCRVLAEQRQALVEGSLKVLGLLNDPLLADVLDEALRKGGVTVFDPVGQRMDAACHRIDHILPAADPADEGIVAETLAPGYLDGTRVLRPASVSVYKWRPTQGADRD